MNNKKLQDLFTEFEDATAKNFPFAKGNISDKIKFLKNKRINPYYSEFEFIDFCRKYRNLVTHNIEENKYLNFTNEMIEKFEKVIYEVKNPYTIYSKATKNIFDANIEDCVRDKMEEMIEKSYTHIPVYRNKKLVGIFSENTLFTYLYKNKLVEITDDTKFSDIEEYIDINNLNEIIKFVSKDELYDNVVNNYIKEFKEGNRLECVMVTNSGSKEEKVIGILTSWDVIGR